MTSKSLSLPPARTGPASKGAEMTRAFARHGIDPEMREAITTAIKSGLLPQSIRSPEQATVIALLGRELGLPMMQAFRSIYVVNGLPSIAASLMLGCAYRRIPTFDLRVVTRDTKVCVLEGRRSPATSWVRASYSIEEASTAGLLGKANWKANPAAMLAARATAALCRLVAPDVFSGLYASEEVADGGAPIEEPVQPVDIPAQATVSTEATAAPPSEPQTASGPRREDVMADLAEAAKTGGEVRAATQKLGYASKTKKEWTLDMALAVAVEAGLPGYVGDGSTPHNDADPFSGGA